MAIRGLSRVITSRLSGNPAMPMARPSGMPRSDARTIDQPATLSDVQTAEKTSQSRDSMREKAVPNDSPMKPTVLFFPVDEEDRLVIGLVAGDDPLSFRSSYEVDEFHRQVVLHVGVLLRVDGNDPVRVEQTLF